MAERVAFLGTGIMGAPMARNLLNAGFQVRVWNRTPDKARVLAAEGAELAETPADAVRDAAFVITMLIDGAAVLAVMGQAAESVPDGAVWLQTSMVGNDVARVAGLAQDHGITFVNCPVLGTRDTAKDGRLVVLASGAGDILDRAQPVFDAIAFEDRQAPAGCRSREPHDARGERLGRGARGEPPPLAGEARIALGALAQERLAIAIRPVGRRPMLGATLSTAVSGDLQSGATVARLAPWAYDGSMPIGPEHRDRRGGCG